MVEIAAEKCDCTEEVSPTPRSAGRLASDLVAYGISRGLVDPLDSTWAYNSLLEAVGETGPAPVAGCPDIDLEATYLGLAEVAVANGLFEDSANLRATLPSGGVLTARSGGIEIIRQAYGGKNFLFLHPERLGGESHGFFHGG